MGSNRIDPASVFVEMAPSVGMLSNAVAVAERIKMILNQASCRNRQKLANGINFPIRDINRAGRAGAAGPALKAFKIKPCIKKIALFVLCIHALFLPFGPLKQI